MNKKIRILFHIDELSKGGAEKVLCNLVNNMDLRKFDITVHTTYKCEARRFLNPGITYKYVFVNKNRLTNVQYRLENSLKLFYALHLKDEYDIEVAYLECGPTKVVAGSTNKNAVKLAWVHCNLEKKAGNNVFEFVKKTRGYYSKFDKVICVSEDCRLTFEKLFGKFPEALVIHNTIDSAEILSKSLETLETKMPEKKIFALVSCGRLTAQKNFQMLIKCVQRLSELPFELWIIGEGEEHQKLQDYIISNKLENRVKLLGYQSNPYPIMKKADLYVCSSRYEGYSTTAVEALILGVPVITTDCTGMHEILENSEFGLITPNNEDGLTSGLEKMIADKELLQLYRLKAKERGISLSGEKTTQQTEQYFENLVR